MEKNVKLPVVSSIQRSLSRGSSTAPTAGEARAARIRAARRQRGRGMATSGRPMAAIGCSMDEGQGSAVRGKRLVCSPGEVGCFRWECMVGIER